MRPLKSKKNAIIHIGGSRFQVKTIEWAKQAGLYVVVTDKSPDPPGARTADRFAQVSGTDAPALLNIARELSKTHQFKGIWCHADFGLMSKAKVHAALGLSGPSPEAVLNALDKNRSKSIWQQRGIRTPSSVTVATASEAVQAASKMDFPLIVKPLDASGSMGITCIKHPDEALSAFFKAHQWGARVIIETFLEGRQFGLNGIFHEDRFYAAGISERRTDSTGCLLTEVIVPPSLDAAIVESMYQLLHQAALSLGIHEGCVKGDIILSGRTPFVIELAPRLHGNPTMSHAIPAATGISPVRLYFDMLAGKKFIEPDLASTACKYCAGYRPIFCKDGIIEAINGIGQAEKLPGIEDIVLLTTPGHCMQQHNDNRDIIGYIFGKAKTQEILRTRMARAYESLDRLITYT